PTSEGGMAFVHIRRGEAYRLRLINNSPYEAAVTVSIDGVDLYAFFDEKNPETGQPRYSRVIVSPRSSTEVKGWRRTMKSSDALVVGKYARSGAAEWGIETSDVGVITACFHASWPTRGRPPADEPRPPAAKKMMMKEKAEADDGDGGGTGTGRGSM